jgi:hypothetical protein
MRARVPMSSWITRMLGNGEDAAMRKTLRSTATQTVRRRLPEAAAGFVRAANPPTATDLQAELTELERLSLDDHGLSPSG